MRSIVTKNLFLTLAAGVTFSSGLHATDYSEDIVDQGLEIKELPRDFSIRLDNDWSAPLSQVSYTLKGRELRKSEWWKQVSENGPKTFSGVALYLDGTEKPVNQDTILTLSTSGVSLPEVNKTLQNASQSWKVCAENRREEVRICARSALIPNRYIVQLSNQKLTPREVTSHSHELAEKYGANIHYVYDVAYKGFSAVMPTEVAGELKENAAVSAVSRDGYVKMHTIQHPVPSWGIDRIDERSLTLDSRWTYDSDGTGVNAYVIDSGIESTHSDFTGRIGNGTSFVSGPFDDDCNGHGTHVAGTVLGTQHGLAKNATVVPVRVFGCGNSTTNSIVIAGVNWVTANGSTPAVVNMSLGGSSTSTIDAAVQDSINAGFTYVVSAGNSNANACHFSPAQVNDAITVGATDGNDTRSSYSNFGTCVDIFAPGTHIVSAKAGTVSGAHPLSGTSMSAPHVAGIAALYLQNQPFADPATVKNALLSNATTGVLSGIGSGSPNLLAYWREACNDPVVYHDGSNINPWFDSANCFVMPIPSGASNPFVYNGNYYIDASFNSCPLGNYDGANCFFMTMPEDGFIHNNNFYTTYDACSVGTNDSENCHIDSAPSGTTAFTYNNNFYTTPLPGNVCPVGSFDGANCYLMPKPEGGFIYDNNFYTTYDSCSLGVDDSENCYIASAPANTTAFIYNGNFYTTPDSNSPTCIDGYYDGEHCYIGTAPAASTPFIYDGHFYYSD